MRDQDAVASSDTPIRVYDRNVHALISVPTPSVYRGLSYEATTRGVASMPVAHTAHHTRHTTHDTRVPLTAVYDRAPRNNDTRAHAYT